MDETSVRDAGVAWEGGEVVVAPEPPGSPDSPPQAARAVINKNVNALRETRV